MNRVVQGALVVGLMVGLAGCGGEPPAQTPTDQQAPTDKWVKATPFPGMEDQGGAEDHGVFPEGNPINDEEPSWLLKNEEPVELTSYQVVSDKQIRVFFQTGNDRCYGAKYTVKETPEAIEIQVRDGLYLTTDACTAEATFQSMLIDLKEPVGDREIRQLTS